MGTPVKVGLVLAAGAFLVAVAAVTYFSPYQRCVREFAATAKAHHTEGDPTPAELCSPQHMRNR